jgi:hypothetical protein
MSHPTNAQVPAATVARSRTQPHPVRRELGDGPHAQQLERPGDVARQDVGARACFVGRAYLYGLMAGGERGVQRVADILARDITRTLQLLGVGSMAELTPDRVRLRP